MAAHELTTSSSPIFVNSKHGPVVHPSERTVEYYNTRLSRIYGIVQLVCGGVALILNALGIALHVNMSTAILDPYEPELYIWQETSAYYVGVGIWCNVFIGLSGAFALRAAKTKTSCMVVSNMVLSTVASVTACAMVGLAGWAFVEDTERLAGGLKYKVQHGSGDNVYWTEEVATAFIPQARQSMAISTFFVLVSVVELVVCVLNSTLCCRVTCCCFKESSTPVMYQSLPDHSHVMMVNGKGQPIADAHVMQVPPNTEQMSNNI